ncbi:MAG: endonuclease/exonuclease/phosphatase family protein [Planctomycetia bacterium]|nr:endonuclease/exonuclease/phosphatase family protein [Planctomycetia bacterium]
MTFNLRYASDRPPNAWHQRRPVTRALLEEVRPDIVGTQEGLYQQVKDIESDLADYAWIGLGRDGGSRGEFMAVYYRRDRFEPLAFDHFWLSDTPERIGSSTWGNSNRRMVTWVRFRDRRANHEFYFFNTHFDHQVQEAREKSAALLLKRVAQLATPLPVIVVGDFNAAAEANPAYDTLVGADGFADTWKTADKHGEAIGTFHNYAGPKPDGQRIDWILTRGPVRALSTSVVTFAQEGQYPSDHFPVVATLAWQTKTK